MLNPFYPNVRVLTDELAGGVACFVKACVKPAYDYFREKIRGGSGGSSLSLHSASIQQKFWSCYQQ